MGKIGEARRRLTRRERRERQRRWRAAECRHLKIDGLTRTCLRGIDYEALVDGDRPGSMLRAPCMPGHVADDRATRTPESLVEIGPVASCDHYEAIGEEQAREEEEEFARRLASIAAGKSPCCGAPIDDSAVIRSGYSKGHGLRFCSRCRAVLFIV